MFSRVISGSEITTGALMTRLRRVALDPTTPAERRDWKDAVSLLAVVGDHKGQTLGDIKRAFDRKAFVADVVGVGSFLGAALIGAMAAAGTDVAFMHGMLTSSMHTFANAFSLLGASGLGVAGVFYPLQISHHAKEVSAKLARFGEEMSATRPVALLTYNPGQRLTCCDSTPDPLCVKVAASASA